MTWLWPLRGVEPLFPDAIGRYGVRRRNETHTGVDLYCERGTPVLAVEDGVVTSIEVFTGPDVPDMPSPWWNDTKSVLVKGATGVVAYGEVEPTVGVGDIVVAGQTIATVVPVLKKFKGRPMSMLHLELYTPETQWTAVAHGDDPLPENLRNPEPFLMHHNPANFDLAEYDGVSYIDADAPRTPSRWWVHWGGKP